MQQRQAFIPLPSLTYLELQTLLGIIFLLLSSFCARNPSLLEAVKSHAYYPQTSGVQIPEGNPKHSPTSGEMAIYKAHCLMLRKVVSQTHFLP
jgi:hypothetical protein